MSAAAATPLRRALLAGAIAPAAATVVAGASSCRPVAASAAGADAELLALCAAWRRAMDRNAVVVDRLANMHESDWSAEDHAQWDETGEAVSDLEDDVFAAKATTLAGVKAKAAVLDRMGDTRSG